MAETVKIKPFTRNNRLVWWLMLALLVLLSLPFLLKKEDGRTYGEAALVKAQKLTTRAIHKADSIYGCVMSGCKGKIIAAAEKPESTITNKGGNTESSSTNAMASPPAYSAFPPYPPYASLPGNGGPSSSGSEAQATAPGASEQMSEAAQDRADPRLTSPTPPPTAAFTPPPTPQTAPGAPAYPPYTGAPQSSIDAPKQTAGPQSQAANATKITPELSKEMVKARRSAMKNNYADAIVEYKKHLASHPDDMNAYGELGNVLLLAQNPPEAAQNYYEAATRLVDGGFIETVTPLLPIIAQFEPMLATLIRQKIARTSRL